MYQMELSDLLIVLIVISIINFKFYRVQTKQYIGGEYRSGVRVGGGGSWHPDCGKTWNYGKNCRWIYQQNWYGQLIKKD